MMKKALHRVIHWTDQIHAYPFGVLLFFLYAAIITYIACAVTIWFPGSFTTADDSFFLAQQLFDTATGLLTAGGIAAPLMDLICHYDLDGKR